MIKKIYLYQIKREKGLLISMLVVLAYTTIFFSAFRYSIMEIPVYRGFFTIDVEVPAVRDVLAKAGYNIHSNKANILLQNWEVDNILLFRSNNDDYAHIVKGTVFHDIIKYNNKIIKNMSDKVKYPILLNEITAKQSFFWSKASKTEIHRKHSFVINNTAYPETFYSSNKIENINVNPSNVISRILLPVLLLMPIILLGSYFILSLSKERFNKSLELILSIENPSEYLLNNIVIFLFIIIIIEYLNLFNISNNMVLSAWLCFLLVPIILMFILFNTLFMTLSDTESEVNSIVSIFTIIFVLVMILPTFFLNYRPIARLSPLSVFIYYLDNKDIDFSFVFQSNFLIIVIDILLLVWILIIFRGERLICHVDIITSVLSGLRYYTAIYGEKIIYLFCLTSAITAVIIGFIMELSISSLSSYIPNLVYILFIIPIFVLIEEILKSLPVVIVYKTDNKSKLIISALFIGFTFFIFEKLIAAIYFEVMFGNLQIFLKIIELMFRKKLFFLTLIIHPISTAAFALFYKKYNYPYAIIPAFTIHGIYNILLLRGVFF